MPHQVSGSSLPLPSHNKDMRCPDCGCEYVGTGPCPKCTRKGIAKSDDEITKKVVDDSDLFKAGG
jgi:hypothetical protein